PTKFSDDLGRRVNEGLDIGYERYSTAVNRAEEIKAMMPGALGPDDVIVMPATTGVAPEGLDWTGDPTFCQPWSLFGYPSVTVPIYHDADAGLPVGIQIVARVGEDLRVLEVARRLM